MKLLIFILGALAGALLVYLVDWFLEVWEGTK